MGHAPRPLSPSRGLLVALALTLGAGCASFPDAKRSAEEPQAEQQGRPVESERQRNEDRSAEAPGPSPAPDGDVDMERSRPWASDPWTDRAQTSGGPVRPARPVRVDLGNVAALERRQWPLLPADVRLGAAWVDGGQLSDDGPALLDLEARLSREAHVTAVLALRAPDDAPPGVIARTPDLCAWARAQRLDLLLVGERDARRGDVVLVLHVGAATPLEAWVGAPPSGEVHDDLAARLASAGLAVLSRGR